MRITESSAPITSSDGNHREFGKDDGTANGCRDFLCTFNTEADMTFTIANGDKGLETSSLTCTGLLLDGHDFHDFILEFGEEVVDDLEFFDGQGEEIDLFH